MPGKIYKRLFVLTLAVWLASSITGCASNSENAGLADASRYAAIAVTLPGFDPAIGARFTWYSPLIWASDAVDVTDELDARITSLVEAEVRQKGYTIVQDRSQADYILGMAVVDGENTETERLKGFFRLYPSLGPGQSRAPSTTAMVGVIRAEDYDRVDTLIQSEILWRSGIELFVVGEVLTQEQREARLGGLIGRLMQSLP